MVDTRVRRVVTGVTAEGRSTVVSDQLVEPITVALNPGGAFYRIWGADEVMTVPSDGREPETKDWFPPAGGFRFTVVTFGPGDATPPSDLNAAIAEMSEKLPGMIESMEPDGSLMHTTPTVDFNFVLSGEIWLQVDEGEEVLLRAGDCIVQSGARHGWRNRSSTPCVMVAAIVGASNPG